MPLIDDDKLLKIYSELEELKEKKEDLQKGYIELKLENIKVNNYIKYTSIIIVTLAIIALLLSLYIFKEQSKNRADLEQNIEIENLIDTVNNNKVPVIKGDENDSFEENIVFAVKIESFKDFKVPKKSTGLKGGIRKLPSKNNSNFKKYIAGEFYTYKNAKTLRDEIRKIGIKNTSIITLYQNKEIPIAKAMKLLSE